MITRFAPSPTGPLHLGHAYAAFVAHDLAQAAGGTFLVRIEDIDQSRARPVWEQAIAEDLAWLGLTYPTPVLRQSDRLAAYGAALDHLAALGVLFPCRCRRRDITAALSAPQEGAALIGPDGPIYPGTCRSRRLDQAEPEDAVRLDMRRAAALLPHPLSWVEEGEATSPTTIDGATLIETVGDVVLARRDMGTSYHLSVVVDDAFQGVTHVTRGVDLAEATPLHVLLQHLLGLPQPVYHHHRLIRDDQGKRLAKRDDARALSLYRAQGRTASDIRQMVGAPSIPSG